MAAQLPLKGEARTFDIFSPRQATKERIRQVRLDTLLPPHPRNPSDCCAELAFCISWSHLSQRFVYLPSPSALLYHEPLLQYSQLVTVSLIFESHI